jgi:hypothetical protein
VFSKSIWKPIEPLPKCSSYKIFYNQNTDGTYKARTSINPQKFYTIKDINDLSSLTDIILSESEALCGIGHNQLDYNMLICNKKQPDFSTNFLEFIRFSAKVINQKGDQCSNVIPFIELQNKIEQLSDEQLIKYNSSKNAGHIIIKALFKDDVDELIDAFSACGGKENSDKFVQNMLIVEAKNNCIVPQMISFKKAKMIAANIAKDYKGQNLLTLNKNRKQLEYDAVMTFTNEIIRKEVSGLLGDYIDDTDNFIADLESYKRLKEFKKKEDISSYVPYVFSLDAMFEISQKAIPIFIKNTLGPKLPEDWSWERKEFFLKENLIKKSQEVYNSCIEEYKSFSKYGEPISDKKLLKYRLETKLNYCKEHPNQCLDNCGGHINLTKSSQQTSDLDTIQACVLRSISNTIEPLTKGIILDQQEALKDYLHLSDKVVDEFSNITWNIIKTCSNDKLSKTYKRSVDIENDAKSLEAIPSSQFEQVLFSCSSEAESKAAGLFIQQVLLSTSSFIDSFNQDIKEELFDKAYSKEAIDKTQEIITTTLQECNDRQRSVVGNSYLEQENVMLCTPAVEIHASSIVIKKQLKQALTDAKLLKNIDALKIIDNFSQCSLDARKKAIKDIGSNSVSQINHLNESENYFERDNSFFYCSQEAISQMSYYLAKDIYKDSVEQIEGLTDKKYALNLSEQTAQIVKSCFDKQIQKLENWSGFKEFNENDGITTLTKKCELEASKVVLPKIIIRESSLQLTPLIKDGFLKDSADRGGVLAYTALELRKKYHISLPKNVKADKRINYSIAESLELHIANGGSQDSFVEELIKSLEKQAIKRIHRNLISDIKSKTKNINQKNKFSSFDKYFSSSCLQDIYKNFIEDQPQSSSSTTITLDVLGSYLKDALTFLEEKDAYHFWDNLEKIKEECNNITKYKDSEDFRRSKFYEIIIKGQVYFEFKNEFKKKTLEQLYTLKKGLAEPNLSIKKKYANYMIKNMEEIFETKLSAQYFESKIFKDDKIYHYILDNFDSIMLTKSKAKTKLTQMLMHEFFMDTSEGLFADQFSKVQIIGTIGIEGVTQAISEANEQATFGTIFGHRFGPNNYAMKNAKDIFKNPKNIENFLEWKQIDPKQRELYIKTIGHSGVIATLDTPSYSPDIKESLMYTFYRQSLASMDIPQDTNQTPFENMAKNSANFKYISILSSLAQKVKEDLEDNEYVDFNVVVRNNVKKVVDNLDLQEPKELLYIPKAINKKEVQNMLIFELKSYLLTTEIENGIDTYKYSDGNTFREKISGKITKEVKKDLSSAATRFYFYGLF